MFDVCILSGWCLHVFWFMLCLLYRVAYYVFLWSMWWVDRAREVGYLLLLLMYASYGHELYMCFDVCHAIFTEVYGMYFLISVVTSTSIQTRLRNVSDFSDLVNLQSFCLLLFCCHVNLMLQRDPCIFWRCSVRMFCRYCCNWPIPALVCNYGVP